MKLHLTIDSGYISDLLGELEGINVNSGPLADAALASLTPTNNAQVFLDLVDQLYRDGIVDRENYEKVLSHRRNPDMLLGVADILIRHIRRNSARLESAFYEAVNLANGEKNEN